MIRIVVSMLLCGSLAVSVNAQAVAAVTSGIVTQESSQRINVSFDNTKLQDAIWTIAKRAGVRILFAGNLLPDRKVNYHGKSVRPIVALEAVLSGTGIKVEQGASGTFELVQTRVTQSVQAQGIIIGKVVDAKTAKGISGATVTVGTDTRSITSEDGSYRLNGVAVGAHALSVRILGYAKQTRSVTVGEGATVTVDFKLEPSANVLDQVIVTGTVARTELRAVPNAITVVTAKQIEDRGITRIDQLFRGEIPGLFSMELGVTSPVFGTASLNEVTMFSRGATKLSTSTDASTITNSIKTYVDGVELSNAQYLSQIDPKSIERIEILTGPQASTIYGANAVNGVMQIFTKRGSSQRPSLTLSLSEGWAENNFSSASSPSHQYDGNISGVEGKISYNVGSGWDYTGAWSPGKQLQRTSVYGGSRYQSQALSLDLSARQGWTRNKVKGAYNQVQIALVEQGTFLPGIVSSLLPPIRRSLSGRTLGATFGYIPFPWWSHQINTGSDASDIESVGLAAGFRNFTDTSYTNSQIPNSRISQSYSSTLHFPIFSLAQATLTYGGDHWRNRTSTISWTKNPDGALSSPSVSRPKPDKNSGVYLQGQFDFWNALFLTYGVRQDWNPTYGEKAKVRPSRYGLSYARDIETRLGSVSTKLRGSYGRSIRPPAQGFSQGSLFPASNPSTLAFYGSGLYQTLPTPQLGPEFQQGGEGGIELYFENRASLVITRYNQTVEGLISRLSAVDSVRALESGYGAVAVINCNSASTLITDQPRSDGYCYYLQGQYINVGSIRNQGWEMQGNVNLGPFTTRGTYSWNKSRVIGVTPKYRDLLVATFGASGALFFAPGQTFNYLPEHTWAMDLSYALKNTFISLNINGVGLVSRNALSSDLAPTASSAIRLQVQESFRMASLSGLRQPTSSYATTNINTSHRFSKKIEATLQITNLTNRYQNDLSYEYPTLGCVFRIGSRLRW